MRPRCSCTLDTRTCRACSRLRAGPQAALDMDDQVGTLEAGKLADVLVVNGNPAENVNDLWNVADVFFEGRKLERGSDDSLAAVPSAAGGAVIVSGGLSAPTGTSLFAPIRH